MDQSAWHVFRGPVLFAVVVVVVDDDDDVVIVVFGFFFFFILIRYRLCRLAVEELRLPLAIVNIGETRADHLAADHLKLEGAFWLLVCFAFFVARWRVNAPCSVHACLLLLSLVVVVVVVVVLVAVVVVVFLVVE
jgi:hypothetical protein